jgi:hypothetical protein
MLPVGGRVHAFVSPRLSAQPWCYPINTICRTQPALSRFAASGSMPHLRLARSRAFASYKTT